jgi:UPF0755 protein
MIKKILIGLAVIILFTGGFFAYKVFGPAVHNKSESFLYIHTGDDMAALKKNLVGKKFINGRYFDLVSRLLKFNIVKPGRYRIEDGSSLVKLVKLLRSGEQAPVKVVIVKERSMEAFAGKFGSNRKFDVEFDSLQLIRFLTSNDSLKKFSVDTNTVIGVIMPYTYNLNWNSTPGDLMNQFYTAYRVFWNESRKIKADSIGLTPMQVMTMASIIEEETNKKDDKPRIASVYLNRLQKGMKLQADPTVKFASKNFTLKRILFSHLNINSPYNTYINTGLPPGPICTPSISTIEAVLNAPKTDYLYFVASDKFDGSSVFATSYNEHMKYARAYQQELTRRMDSARKANSLN